MRRILLLTVAATFIASACGDSSPSPTPSPSAAASSLAEFPQRIDVFGVSIIATESTPADKVAHAAAVMAQYLDNDADGIPDDGAVVAALVENRATLIMAATSSELENLSADTYTELDAIGSLQDLYADETNMAGRFDASLEEVHHLILNYGWAVVYPDELAQAKGSAIADAMDIARGGQFDSIPARYPDGAWYTYDDQTCDYVCMITEYTYWAHTSLLGGQEGRSAEIGREWGLETETKVRATDTAATAILDSPMLGLPTVLPDGDYQD